ncbi:hypothetical protein COV16_02030 [Candidatus Woesearchaeota archaeon CG10_big_fil_rev_8_21_14_0_10_34_8]|nr:MAG: hypothetical protein COV16_02030 [Candidatus Woesearchaeota archaeon CG10_big_fil_rev_8_21_14_0_10_34_8]
MHAAAMNMAIDESILEHISEGKAKPTVRLYGWNPAAITIGNFQCREDEVDMNACKEAGVPVVRRITGGGAVFHEHEITYSILAPETFFPKHIQQSYQIICGVVIEALDKLGIAAQYRPINDIVVGSRKISGSAQTRRKGVLLQHGTILLDVNIAKMFSLLTISKEKISDKYVQSVKKLVTSLLEQNEKLKEEQVIDALMEAFSEGKQVEIGRLSKEEFTRAHYIMKSKYETEEWNNCRK